MTEKRRRRTVAHETAPPLKPVQPSPLVPVAPGETAELIATMRGWAEKLRTYDPMEVLAVRVDVIETAKGLEKRGGES